MNTDKTLKILISILIMAIIALLSSCGGTRNIRSQEALLTDVVIKNNKTRLSEDELMQYVFQKPNRKFLYTTKLFLDVYNITNTQKAEEKYKQHLEERTLKNEERLKQGKDTLTNLPFSFRYLFMKVGEPPIIYTHDKSTRDNDLIPFGKPTLHDSNTIERSRQQLEIILNDNGYFNTKVTDTLLFNKKGNRVKLVFSIEQQPVHKFQNITYTIEDPKMALLVVKNHTATTIKKGDPFSRTSIDQERDRITKLLRDNGYYHFSKQYINFWIDTLDHKDHYLDLTVEILNPQTTDTLVNELAFKTSTISELNIIFQRGIKTNWDSLMFQPNYKFLYENRLPFNTNTISDHVSIQPNTVYNESEFNKTYTYLSRLKIFRTRIITDEVIDSTTFESYLKTSIILKPLFRQTYSFEIQGSNTGGNFGIPLQMSYINRSLFKGIEELRLTLTTALENQANVVPIKDKIPFNTFRITPSASLTFPKFLFPFKINWIKNHDFTTTINLLFGYENRREHYIKRSIEFNLNYKGNLNNKWSVIFTPVEISYLNNNLSPQFVDSLNTQLDDDQKRRYISKMIPDSRLILNYNTNYGKFKQHSFGFSTNLETAGLLLRTIKQLTNAPLSGSVSDPYYVASNVRFSQYWRAEFQAKTYFKVTSFQTLAARVLFGMAKPYGNDFALPFEKAFFSGGTNSIRAWRAYRLGLGGLNGILDATSNFDRVGDVKFELNFESRTKLYGFLESAIFIDIGNIWSLNKELLDKPDLMPSYFLNKSLKKLATEMVIGAGVGLRMNFSFFIIRIDPAVKIYNPGFYDTTTPNSQFWIHQRPFSFKDINWNFAIGYPF